MIHRLDQFSHRTASQLPERPDATGVTTPGEQELPQSALPNLFL